MRFEKVGQVGADKVVLEHRERSQADMVDVKRPGLFESEGDDILRSIITLDYVEQRRGWDYPRLRRDSASWLRSEVALSRRAVEPTVGARPTAIFKTSMALHLMRLGDGCRLHGQ
jgi:hypothetical protein